MIPTLVLVPTSLELGCLSESFQKKKLSNGSVVRLCGFGPVVSGIQTANLIAQHQPQAVLLVGIAGSYDHATELGTCLEFDDVACYGIGVGTGSDFLSASEMGWMQWPADDQGFIVADSIRLTKEPMAKSSKQLLTCCSASSNLQDAVMRKEKFPHAIAEDMEGFAVAAACQLSKTSLRIVRGISNMAGIRDRSQWRIREAMLAVETAVRTIIF